MIGYIISGLIGYFISSEMSNNQNDKEKDDAFPYWIGIRFDEDAQLDKVSLEYSNYDDAKKAYEKLINTKHISVNDVLENSKSERSLKKLLESKNEKYTPSGKQKVYEIAWGINDDTFEQKEF